MKPFATLSLAPALTCSVVGAWPSCNIGVILGLHRGYVGVILGEWKMKWKLLFMLKGLGFILGYIGIMEVHPFDDELQAGTSLGPCFSSKLHHVSCKFKYPQ